MPDRFRNWIKPATLCLVGCQPFMLAVITLGEFGFYFPGRMGNWTAWMAWVLSYTLVLALGCGGALVLGELRLVIVQLVILLLFMLPFLLDFVLFLIGDIEGTGPDFESLGDDS